MRKHRANGCAVTNSVPKVSDSFESRIDHCFDEMYFAVVGAHTSSSALPSSDDHRIIVVTVRVAIRSLGRTQSEGEIRARLYHHGRHFTIQSRRKEHMNWSMGKAGCSFNGSLQAHLQQRGEDEDERDSVAAEDECALCAAGGERRFHALLGAGRLDLNHRTRWVVVSPAPGPAPRA